MKFIKNLYYIWYEWHIKNLYAELDMDMMCTNMTYKQYCREQKLIDLIKETYDNKKNN